MVAVRGAMPKLASFVLALFLVACAYDVPEHDALVESDCSGSVERARFHFEAFDFETNCTGQRILTSSCTPDSGVGRRVAGDLDAESLFLEGSEHGGPSRYVLDLPQPYPARDLGGPIQCAWDVNESLELTSSARTGCDFAPSPCTAKLTIFL